MALIPESPEAKARLAHDLLKSLARAKSDLVANEGLRKQPANSPECWEGKWTNRRVIDELKAHIGLVYFMHQAKPEEAPWNPLFVTAVQSLLPDYKSRQSLSKEFRADPSLSNWKSVFQFLEVGSSKMSGEMDKLSELLSGKTKMKVENPSSIQDYATPIEACISQYSGPQSILRPPIANGQLVIDMPAPLEVISRSMTAEQVLRAKEKIAEILKEKAEVELKTAVFQQTLLSLVSLNYMVKDKVITAANHLENAQEIEKWRASAATQRDELIQVLVAKTRGQMTLARVPVDSVAEVNLVGAEMTSAGETDDESTGKQKAVRSQRYSTRSLLQLAKWHRVKIPRAPATTHIDCMCAGAFGAKSKPGAASAGAKKSLFKVSDTLKRIRSHVNSSSNSVSDSGDNCVRFDRSDEQSNLPKAGNESVSLRRTEAHDVNSLSHLASDRLNQNEHDTNVVNRVQADLEAKVVAAHPILENQHGEWCLYENCCSECERFASFERIPEAPTSSCCADCFAADASHSCLTPSSLSSRIDSPISSPVCLNTRSSLTHCEIEVMVDESGRIEVVKEVRCTPKENSLTHKETVSQETGSENAIKNAFVSAESVENKLKAHLHNMCQLALSLDSKKPMKELSPVRNLAKQYQEALTLVGKDSVYMSKLPSDPIVQTLVEIGGVTVVGTHDTGASRSNVASSIYERLKSQDKIRDLPRRFDLRIRSALGEHVHESLQAFTAQVKLPGSHSWLEAFVVLPTLPQDTVLLGMFL